MTIESSQSQTSSELLPTEQARRLVDGLTDYLSTTFALSEGGAQAAIGSFLEDPQNGMFKGPYVRLRLPFAAAEGDATDVLDSYTSDFTPYGHQAAAFGRLSSKGTNGELFRRPQPTLVTTGTGSGKTEAFLYPIIDHVLRAQKAGIRGVKALILYPMNALANDQAQRLTEMLQHPDLAGIRAGIYTGQKDGSRRTVMSPRGLINDRHTFRDNPPDILLTNYKMLDMLLLRHDDAPIWQQSATSLQYIVLDEFHTYDGAQGTDVAMLLRRLGLTLKSHWPADLSTVRHGPVETDRARPLGRMTPVATSATLGTTSVTPENGENNDVAHPMLEFAHTVFGERFGTNSIVTESRLSADEWCARATSAGTAPGVGGTSLFAPRDLEDIALTIKVTNDAIKSTASTEVNLERVVDALFDENGRPPVCWSAGHRTQENIDSLLAALRQHPLSKKLIETANNAVALVDLADVVFPHRVLPEGIKGEDAETFLGHVLSLYSHVRAIAGRAALTVETHLWARELSRIDAALDLTHDFRWSDDGTDEADLDHHRVHLPAIFCRHCGRNGWGGLMAPTGTELIMDPDQVRQASMQNSTDFRALLSGTNEAEAAFLQRQAGVDEPEVEGLRYLHTANHTLASDIPDEDEADFEKGLIIPVLTHPGLEAGDLSAKDVCPACHAPDAIRFIGSAIATLLSVAISNLFGAEELNDDEKKALVFTDSVQDAAHRAGFVQARSRTFSLRTVLHNALPAGEITSLTELIEATMWVGDGTADASRRYELVPPELTDRDEFRVFWDPKAAAAADAGKRRRARDLVRKRLSFDAALEFGLQSRLGRTLELTGSVAVETQAGNDVQMIALARRVLESRVQVPMFERSEITDAQLMAWLRGILVRIRLQGGIAHPWLNRYIRRDGHRWNIWGGRARGEGMPAFPSGRPAPVFPKIGGSAGETNFDAVLGRSTWYSRWTVRCLDVAHEDAGYLAKALFDEMVGENLLDVTRSETGADIYSLSPDRLLLSIPDTNALEAGKHTLKCSVCEGLTFGTDTVVRQLEGAPCLMVRCPGSLAPSPVKKSNFYRDLYASTNGKRVVAHEHSSLLDDKTRVQVETDFKSGAGKPDAPNVLVATPTLEMGIDIGDLSTVMLSSMPNSVASYVQRVGRAGRLTGNSLAMAFVRGRGQHLPKLNDPLSVIGGDVRPPATYLDAEEILSRQFLAYLADRLAQDKAAPHPDMARDALGSLGTDTFLGALIGETEIRGEEHLQAFLQQFTDAAGGELISTAGCQRLRHWVLGDGENTAPLAMKLAQASRQWNEDLEEISRRITELDQTVIPELKTDAEEAARLNDEDSSTVREARHAVSAAIGTLKRMRKQRDEQLLGTYWISLMESYGLFPNYTLIGDTVQLDVGLSWRNEETQEFEAEVRSYHRGAAAALREFAPGSTFYAGGLEIKVDAVDLGAQQRDLEKWQVCPACGWVNKDFTALAPTCLRCHAADINDTGQILNVAVLRKVSAEIRRDESVIGDRQDDRHRTSFHIVPAADIDQHNVTDRWFVEDFEFGIEYFSNVDIRWLNLGERGRQGPTTSIAGHEIAAPLFHLCDVCGQQDRSAKQNSPDEHRFWCKHRKSKEEHVQTVALAYELKTQAILLHVPIDLTVSDDFALPTLKAALLLGLQESLGGTPGHLGVIAVPDTDPTAAGVESPATALLLHDTVPGGTGYLAEFTQPENVHALLRAAWEKVRDCECQKTGRLACHHCLLPHADYGTEDQVSRSAAERLLGTLLAGTQHTQAPTDESFEPVFSDWTVTKEKPEQHANGESHLEVRFRHVLIEHLQTLGAKVQQKDVQGRRTLQFQLPSQNFYWFLEEQVDMHGTRPDFVLRHQGGGEGIAIYTDGRQFHASPAHNRTADDAVKRHRLREHGIMPWAITSRDLDDFTAGGADHALPPWFEPKFVDAMMKKHSLSPSLLQAISVGAMALLWEWINDPQVEAWNRFADTVPLFMLEAKPRPLEAAKDLSGQLLKVMTPDAVFSLLGGNQDAATFWWTRERDFVSIILSGRPDHPGGTRAILCLDDHEPALYDEAHADAWRHWLLVSNLLGFKTHGAAILTTRSAAEITTLLQLPSVGQTTGVPSVSVGSSPLGADDQPTGRINAGWAAVLEQALDDDELGFFNTLARLDITPTPMVGEEINGWPTILSWDSEGIAVLADTEGVDALTAAGWQVIGGTDDEAAERIADLLSTAPSEATNTKNPAGKGS